MPMIMQVILASLAGGLIALAGGALLLVSKKRAQTIGKYPSPQAHSWLPP